MPKAALATSDMQVKVDEFQSRIEQKQTDKEAILNAEGMPEEVAARIAEGYTTDITELEQSVSDLVARIQRKVAEEMAAEHKDSLIKEFGTLKINTPGIRVPSVAPKDLKTRIEEIEQIIDEKNDQLYVYNHAKAVVEQAGISETDLSNLPRFSFEQDGTKVTLIPGRSATAQPGAPRLPIRITSAGEGHEELVGAQIYGSKPEDGAHFASWGDMATNLKEAGKISDEAWEAHATKPDGTARQRMPYKALLSQLFQLESLEVQPEA